MRLLHYISAASLHFSVQKVGDEPKL